MSCKPTYKGKRYNSLEELYKANGVNEHQKQQVQQLYSNFLDKLVKRNFDKLVSEMESKNLIEKKCN